MPDSALKITNLSYHYGKLKALDNLSFSVSTGQFFGLLGPNGAGKSTLMALLTRLLRPDSGTIEIFNRRLDQHPSRSMADIGVVFQQSTLDPDLSVVQNLKYHGSLHGLSPRVISARIDEQLHRFELEEKRDAPIRQLNGGHRRRVELARALLHKPKLLLLDEATAGLDVESRAALNQYVRQLCQEQQITALWTTHLIEELQERDQLLILHRGKSRACGVAAELLAEHKVNDIASLFSELTKPITSAEASL